MQGHEYEAVVVQGPAGPAYYCTECAPDNVEAKPIFATMEVDQWPVCEECGYVHTYMSGPDDDDDDEDDWCDDEDDDDDWCDDEDDEE